MHLFLIKFCFTTLYLALAFKQYVCDCSLSSQTFLNLTINEEEHMTSNVEEILKVKRVTFPPKATIIKIKLVDTKYKCRAKTDWLSQLDECKIISTPLRLKKKEILQTIEKDACLIGPICHTEDCIYGESKQCDVTQRNDFAKGTTGKIDEKQVGWISEVCRREWSCSINEISLNIFVGKGESIILEMDDLTLYSIETKSLESPFFLNDANYIITNNMTGQEKDVDLNCVLTVEKRVCYDKENGEVFEMNNSIEKVKNYMYKIGSIKAFSRKEIKYKGEIAKIYDLERLQYEIQFDNLQLLLNTKEIQKDVTNLKMLVRSLILYSAKITRGVLEDYRGRSNIIQSYNEEGLFVVDCATSTSQVVPKKVGSVNEISNEVPKLNIFETGSLMFTELKGINFVYENFTNSMLNKLRISSNIKEEGKVGETKDLSLFMEIWYNVKWLYLNYFHILHTAATIIIILNVLKSGRIYFINQV